MGISRESREVPAPSPAMGLPCFSSLGFFDFQVHVRRLCVQVDFVTWSDFLTPESSNRRGRYSLPDALRRADTVLENVLFT
jgi:hypothetical protein